MLVAGQNTAAPPVTCPLDRKGWHAIYFGIRSYGYNEGQHPAAGALEDGHRLFP